MAAVGIDGQVLYCNAAFGHLTGHSPSDFSAHPLADFCHPKDCVALRALLDQAAAGLGGRAELRFRTRDGLVVWIRYSVSPAFNPDGTLRYLTVIGEDVTGREQMETRLLHAEAQFRAMADATPECVKLVDSEGTLLHMNAAGLHIVGAESSAAVEGKSVYSLIAPEHRDRFEAFNRNRLRR